MTFLEICRLNKDCAFKKIGLDTHLRIKENSFEYKNGNNVWHRASMETVNIYDECELITQKKEVEFHCYRDTADNRIYSFTSLIKHGDGWEYLGMEVKELKQ